MKNKEVYNVSITVSENIKNNTENTEKLIKNNKSETKIDVDIVDTKHEKILSEDDIENKLKELGDFDPTLELSQYKMPAMNLLKDYGGSKIEIDRSELEKIKK